MAEIDHFEAAERLLQEAGETQSERGAILALRAQGHALLALASATAPDVYPPVAVLGQRDVAEEDTPPREAAAEPAAERPLTEEQHQQALVDDLMAEAESDLSAPHAPRSRD